MKKNYFFVYFLFIFLQSCVQHIPVDLDIANTLPKEVAFDFIKQVPLRKLDRWSRTCDFLREGVVFDAEEVTIPYQRFEVSVLKFVDTPYSVWIAVDGDSTGWSPNICNFNNQTKEGAEKIIIALVSLGVRYRKE